MREIAVIEFVYFDLGNILLSFDPALACNGLAKLVGVTPDRAREALYDSGLEVEYEHGRLSSAEFADRLRRALDLRPTDAPDQAIIESISDMFTPIASMIGVLDAVRMSGCRVGLLSNTCEGHWRWIQDQQFRLMDFQFDAQILSYEIGSMKPDRAIYEAAERLAEVPVDQILFLDDRRENVVAARSFGWNAAQCLGGSEVIEALREFRVVDLVN